MPDIKLRSLLSVEMLSLPLTESPDSEKLSNKKKAKKGAKIALIVLGILVAIDVISFVVYFAINGFPS